jgi:Ca2+-binding RTX toxin-like protein
MSLTRIAYQLAYEALQVRNLVPLGLGAGKLAMPAYAEPKILTTAAPADRIITEAQLQQAQNLVEQGRRVEAYVLLAELTQCRLFLTTAQIASGSGPWIGGPALNVNALLEVGEPRVYPEFGVEEFSKRVALKEIEALRSPTRIVEGGGAWVVPSELEVMNAAREAWLGAKGQPDPNLQALFPGNLLLLYHYAWTGDGAAFDSLVQSMGGDMKVYGLLVKAGQAAMFEVLDIGPQFGLTRAQAHARAERGGSIESRTVLGEQLTIYKDGSGAAFAVFRPQDDLALDRQPGLGLSSVAYGTGPNNPFVGQSSANFLLSAIVSYLGRDGSDKAALLSFAAKTKTINDPNFNFQRSVEQTVNALHRLLVDPHAAPQPTGDTAVSMQRLVSLLQAPGLASSQTLISLIGKPASTITSLALQHDNQGLAVRYALKNLSLLAIPGADFSVLSAAEQSGLVLAGSNSPNGLSAFWIQERANMLSNLIELEKRNVGSDAAIEDRRYLSNRTYTDLVSGLTVKTRGSAANSGSTEAQKIVFGTDEGDEISGSDALTQIEGDVLFGGEGHDTLKGRGGADWLDGGGGNDVLTGGSENDILWGGAGIDTYRFDESFGNDLIADTDGQGSIEVGGSSLEGQVARFVGISGQIAWQVKVGSDEYRYTLQSERGELVIAKLVGDRVDTENTITIKNFDRARAESPHGYLGLRLDSTPYVAVKKAEGSAKNFWSDPNANLANLAGQASTITEGVGQTFVVFLNAAARAGETLVLRLNDLTGKAVKAILGDTTVDADGAAITLAEGQTQVSFALVHDGSLDSDATGSLVVTYQGQDQSATSNTWGLTLEDSGQTQATLNGDFNVATTSAVDPIFRPGHQGSSVIVVERSADQFIQSADGNLAPAAEGVLVTSNVIYGSSRNDAIDGKSGNDLLGGGAGNDVIDGGSGDDMIGGGSGNDRIRGGEGNDFIVSSANPLVDMQQFGPQDNWRSWGLPAGATEVASGATWGVYRRNGAMYWSGMSSIIKTAQSDWIDGGEGNDHIIASWGDDRAQGGDGDDDLTGLAGDDVLEGGEGDDLLYGDGQPTGEGFGVVEGARHGSDFLDGGTGNDELYGHGGADNLFGGAGNDKLFGDTVDVGDSADFVPLEFHGADYLDGEDGDDGLEGGGGDDTLYGGEGADSLWGDMSLTRLGPAAADARAWSSDYLYGEGGNDLLIGGGNDDQLFGGDDNDTLIGDERSTSLQVQFHGRDYLDGEDGEDRLFGGGDDDVLYGGAGDDVLWGDDRQTFLAGVAHGADHLDGDDGHDTLIGGGGADRMFGGDGADAMYGDASASLLGGAFHGGDFLDGEAGDDALVGGGGEDHLVGGVGDDLLIGDDEGGGVDAQFHGADTLEGGAGDDVLLGNGGNDALMGGAGNDLLQGGAGDDILDGGEGGDHLSGGAGDDMLYGDALDVLEGGEGNDTYVLTIGEGDTAIAQINDAFGANQIVLAGDVSGSDLALFVEGGQTYLASDGRAVAMLSETTTLAGLSVVNADDGLNLQQVLTARSPNGLVRSMAIVDGRVVETATLTAAQELFGSVRADGLDGGTGDDLLEGGAGDDELLGGDGNDEIDGGEGDDLLAGGRGSDVLIGGEDDADVYVFARGDGADRIERSGGGGGPASDVIRFGAGITAASLQLIPGLNAGGSGNSDLVIAYGAGDSITFAPGSFASFAEIQFADGTTLSRNQVLAGLASSHSGSSERVIRTERSWTPTHLVGEQGADILSGGSGNDVLIGGGGNDVLNGRGGSNVYVFGAQSGLDTIVRSDFGGDGPGLLQFTASGFANLEAWVDGPDVVVRQVSGAAVRVRDVNGGPRIDIGNWNVMDATGAVVSLRSLLPSSEPDRSLEERKERFVGEQIVQLGTLPQRAYWSDSSESVQDISVPVSVVQVNRQIGESGEYIHGHYLATQTQSATTVSYTTSPIYKEVVRYTPGVPAWFLAIEDAYPWRFDGAWVPANAVPVIQQGVRDFDDQEAGGSGVLIGWQIPGVPEQREVSYKLIGYSSSPVYGTTYKAADAATQTLLSGTAGNDLISWASLGGQAVLFRGTIETGAGNDRVVLASGANGLEGGLWTRLEEWRPSYSLAQQWAPPGSYTRGWGAWIDTGDGDDEVAGTDGNDVIIGGAGSDHMDGQAGSDTYIVSFTPGSIDRISDLAFEIMHRNYGSEGVPLGAYNQDTVEFDATIDRSSLSYRWSFGPFDGGAPATLQTLELFTNEQRFLQIDSLADELGSAIEKVRFADGTTLSLSELISSLPVQVNRAPTATDTQVTISAQTGELQLDLSTYFDDLDGDSLSYSYVGTLPWFLNLDPSGRLAGQVDIGEAGVYTLLVQAQDAYGSAEIEVTIDIAPANVAPFVDWSPGDLSIDSGTDWQFDLAGYFFDPNQGDQLTFTAVVAGTSVLPSFLQFDSMTGVLTAMASDADVGTYTVHVVATDTGGLLSDVLVVNVEVGNGAPVLANPEYALTAVAGVPYTRDLSAWFADLGGSAITLSATLEDGSPLPGTLSLDPTTGLLSGTFDAEEAGSYGIRVQATDALGAIGEHVVWLEVRASNQAPEVWEPLVSWSARAGDDFWVDLAYQFSDPDGDQMTFQLAMNDGSEVPGFFVLDPSTGALVLREGAIAVEGFYLLMIVEN